MEQQMSASSKSGSANTPSSPSTAPAAPPVVAAEINEMKTTITKATTSTTASTGSSANANTNTMEEHMFNTAGSSNVGPTKIGIVSQSGAMEKNVAKPATKTETVKIGAMGVATIQEPSITYNEQPITNTDTQVQVGQAISSGSSSATSSSTSSSSLTSSITPEVSSMSISGVVTPDVASFLANYTAQTVVTDTTNTASAASALQPAVDTTMDISQMDPILGMFGNDMAAIEQFINTGAIDPQPPVQAPIVK